MADHTGELRCYYASSRSVSLLQVYEYAIYPNSRSVINLFIFHSSETPRQSGKFRNMA